MVGDLPIGDIQDTQVSQEEGHPRVGRTMRISACLGLRLMLGSLGSREIRARLGLVWIYQWL